MALDSGVITQVVPTGVARTDHNILVSSVNSAFPVKIVDGGHGFSTKNSGFNALSPTGTKGDFPIYTNSGINGIFQTSSIAGLRIVTSANHFGWALESSSGGWTISSITADPSPAVVGTFYLADVSGGDFTITLPAASGNSGKRIGVKLITGTANTLTIDGNGSETIDGSTTQTLDIQYDSITLLCDGSNWYII